MLGGVVKFQFAGNPSRFFRREGRISDAKGMNDQAVQHDPNPLGVGEMKVHSLLQQVGKVAFLALSCRLQRAPAGQGLEQEEEVGTAFPLILVVPAPDGFRLRGQRFANMAEQLNRTFIDTNNGQAFVKRLSIEFQYILHAPNELATHAGNALFPL